MPKLKRPLRGEEKGGDVLAVQRALNRSWSGEPIPVTEEYDQTTRDRMTGFQRAHRIKPASGRFGQPSLDALWPFFDAYGKLRYRLFRVPKVEPVWGHVGPVQPEGSSLLDMSLTHDTSNIPLFPAVDTAWGGGGGVVVIAPENCVVDTKDTSAGRPGEAVYLTGDSKLRHWVGHLDRDWPLGHRFEKGDVIGKTLPIPGQSDHAHWGVNAEALLGKGKQFKYGRDGNGPDYTLGAPTIREQLERALV